MSDETHELEWQTRKIRIDSDLVKDWSVIQYKENLVTESLSHHVVTEFPTANGPADYVFFIAGKIVGILEAKKVSTNPQEVLEQAKRYSRGISAGMDNWGGYRVPLLYSSNGEIVWFLDVRDKKNIRRKITGIHSPAGMLGILECNNDTAIDKLKRTPVLENERLRPYQEKAINEIETALFQSKREMLVAMATGTGKTFLTVSQIYRLLNAGLFKRVLFLVDRKALAAQAVKAFAAFDTPNGTKFDKEYEVYSQAFQKDDFGESESFNPKLLPNVYLTNPQNNHTFVYVCTIQRMAMNLFGRDALSEESLLDIEEMPDDYPEIPIHAFDLIVADECHRGYTSKETSVWRNTIEYFDSVRIGLTATPAPHSLSLFKEVVSRYTTEQAITDGFLVDYDAIKIASGVKINGVFLSEGQNVGIVDEITGQINLDYLEDEREFTSTEIERNITIPDTNRKIITELKKYADAFETETGRFPKTLIFAVNDLRHTSHADQVVRFCREIFGRGDAFVSKITGSPSVDRPLQRIREFRNRPEPKIVVTVDMLTTGVDIPAIEFIVFLRPVKSRILWTQMLGRGTRLCKDIGKTHFTIFDCFDGSLIEYFKDTTEFAIEAPQKDTVSIEQVIEHIWQNTDREYNIKVLVKRLRRIEKNMTGEAREQFGRFIQNGDMGKFASELTGNLESNFIDIMTLLRNKDFQNLLVHYHRARSLFIIGYEVTDTVSSEWLFKVGENSLKPEDYLLSFERFVKENPEHIDAIDILLKRPKDWKTDVLNELRDKLRQEQFSETDLQKAHKIVYNKALADIISMVKHASTEAEPILTAPERVENVMRMFMGSTAFTTEQIKWLELIREHLTENLTIEVEDFEIIPIFERRGGKSRAKKLFADLDSMVFRLNELIAS